MHIRRATESDAAELSALVIAAKQHWGYAGQQIEAWRPILSITGEFLLAHPAFVAEQQARMAGFYALIATGPSWQLD